MTPVLACGGCGQPAGARDVAPEVGPGGSLYLTAPPRFRRRSSKESEPTDPQLLYPETMAILGDRWSGVVLALAFMGVRRFVDFESAAGASPTGGERPAADAGRRWACCGTATEREYRMTEKGLGFFPVLALVIDWAERWMGGGEEPALRLMHTECSEELAPGSALRPLRRGAGAHGRAVRARAVKRARFRRHCAG